MLLMGTGKNCTKTKLHEGTKFHENKIALRVNFARRYFCTKTNLHEENFAPSVNFARVTTLHGGSILHKSKKNTKKDKLIKKKKKKVLLTVGKG